MKSTQYIIDLKDITNNKEYYVPNKYGDDISDKTIFKIKYDVALKIIIDKWLDVKRIKEVSGLEDNCFALLKKYYVFNKDTYKDNDLECLTLKGEAIDYTKNLNANIISINDFSSLDKFIKVTIKDKKNNNEVVIYENKEEIDDVIKDMQDRLKEHLIKLGKDPDSETLDYISSIKGNYIFNYAYDYINEDYLKKGLVYVTEDNNHDLIYMVDGDDVDNLNDIYKQMDEDRDKLQESIEVEVNM